MSPHPRPSFAAVVVLCLGAACGGAGEPGTGDEDAVGLCPTDDEMIESARDQLLAAGAVSSIDLRDDRIGIDGIDDLNGDGQADAVVRPGAVFADQLELHAIYLSESSRDPDGEAVVCPTGFAGSITAQELAVAEDGATASCGCARHATRYAYDCGAAAYVAGDTAVTDLCAEGDDVGGDPDGSGGDDGGDGEPLEDTCAQMAACAEGSRYFIAFTQDVGGFCSNGVCTQGGGGCHTGLESVIGICANPSPSNYCASQHDSNGHSVYGECPIATQQQ
jgi:hypothetical protein